MERGQLAKQNFENGCNCAQAVLLAFSDRTGLDEATAMKLASSFGGGIGRLREVCGALSGMLMAFGLLCGAAELPAQEEKAAHYARVQQLAAQFRERNGSILCRELLDGVQSDASSVPEKRTAEYYKKRPCAQLCQNAADILEDYLRALDA